MVCLTSCGSQGLPVYTVGARGWHPDRGLSLCQCQRLETGAEIGVRDTYLDSVLSTTSKNI